MAKKMTVREKNQRAKIRKQLKKEGILPPDKPKMNRKKFVQQARSEWDDTGYSIELWVFFSQALQIMLNDTDKSGHISLEAVGVARLIRLVVRLKEFNDMLIKEGRNSFTLKEQYEYIEDIIYA